MRPILRGVSSGPYIGHGLQQCNSVFKFFVIGSHYIVFSSCAFAFCSCMCKPGHMSAHIYSIAKTLSWLLVLWLPPQIACVRH